MQVDARCVEGVAKMKSRRWKKGESLMEAIIALAIIILVSATTLTVINKVDEVEARTSNYSQARLYTMNLYECYTFAESASDPVEEYRRSCRFVLSEATIVTEGEDKVNVSYTTYYYTMVVDVDFSEHTFEATATTVEGEKCFFELKKGTDE